MFVLLLVFLSFSAIGSPISPAWEFARTEQITCLHQQNPEIAEIPPREVPCKLANDKMKCLECADALIDQQNSELESQRLFWEKIIKIFISIFILSLLYLLLQGIYYLVKKSTFGPKIIIKIAIIVTISFIVFFLGAILYTIFFSSPIRYI